MSRPAELLAALYRYATLIGSVVAAAVATEAALTSGAMPLEAAFMAGIFVLAALLWMTEALQNAALEFLRAGDNYRVGYRAAFTFRGDAALAGMATPTLVTATQFDPLRADLARIQHPSPQVVVTPGGTAEETLALCEAFLARHPAPEPPPAPVTTPLPGRSWQQMVDVPGGQLRVRRNTDAAGRVVLVQHDAASSSDQVDPVTRSFIGRRPVLAIDLPGHGESDNTIGTENVTVERYVTVVRQALDVLGIEICDFYGRWGGGHLLRGQRLYWPWFRRKRQGIFWQEPYVDPEMVHLRLANLFKAPVMWRRAYPAQFAYPIEERLADTRQAARANPHCVFSMLPDGMRQWGPALLPFFDAAGGHA